MRGHHFFVFLISSLLCVSCTRDYVCPAYQSYFLIDKKELKKKFSTFNEDSLPKDRRDFQIINEGKYGLKTKNGIANDPHYLIRQNAMASVSTESKYYKKLDPFEAASQLAEAMQDSTSYISLDSGQLYVPGYEGEIIENVDQAIYLRHFGQYLYRPKPEVQETADAQLEEKPLIEDIEEEPVKQKKGFKGLFKKKNKDPEPSEPVEDTSILDDEDEQQ